VAWGTDGRHSPGHPGDRRRTRPYATAALAAGVPAKVVSERLGHATIAITMDAYSRVLPGLDAEAAGTVARLILCDGDQEPRNQEPARPVDKALTTNRPTRAGERR
jgi:integrase